MISDRKAGILLPIFSLPSRYGIGTLGRSAYEFVDFLESAGMQIWQVLPLLPTSYGNSPYQSCAARAFNPYFIDLDLLREEGLLDYYDYENVDFGTNPNRVDYGKLYEEREKILRLAFSRFDRQNRAWKNFLKTGEFYDFALFMTLKKHFNEKPFYEWEEYAVYNKELVDFFAAAHIEDVEFWQFTQYVFGKQWRNLKAYANKHGISIMGDLPIYVAYDSVETWKYGEQLFLLDENGKPQKVAGVPPDAFSLEGQLWGNPVYDWEKLKKKKYGWWKKRIENEFKVFDIVRIDHFRGFDRFYAIPFGASDAKIGEWLDGPKEKLFHGIEGKIVAEDLGIIDDGVRDLMKKTGFAGMKVMEFAFDGNPENEHLPCLYPHNCVAYTGTHDNMPLKGYIDELDEEELARFKACLKRECDRMEVHYLGEGSELLEKTAVRLLFHSRAKTVILPMQDILALGKESRINFPSTFSENNWTYRFKKEDFPSAVASRLKRLARHTDRW